VAATLRYDDRVVFVGDSNTANGYYAEAGGLIDQLGPLGDSLTIVNSGVGGNKIADIEADVAARITDHNPDVVVLWVGVNDASAGTLAAAFRADHDSTLAQILAWDPTVQIVCVSILLSGELWSSVGPAFAGNAFDAAIDALNVEIAASAAAAGVTYVDIRTPGALYESQVNLPEPGNTLGFLTNDGLHVFGVGEVLVGTWIFPFLDLAVDDQTAAGYFRTGKPNYISGASMADDHEGEWLDIGDMDNLSFQATWFGNPTGTFRIEGSNDGPVTDTSTRQEQPSGQVAPATIHTSATNPAAVGGTHMIKLANRAERWVRFVYDRTSGDGELYVAFSGKRSRPRA